jgi:osmotically-inducible protein OsmY
MKSNGKVQEDVYDELKWDPRIHEGDIGVSVSNGVITLSGSIPSYAEKWAAEEAAQKVEGVTAVVNDCKVKGSSKLHDDQEIAEAAIKAMLWNVFVPKDHVIVLVDDGWITLSGTVEGQYQREAAFNTVKFLAGVRGVTNDIVVEPRVRAKDIQYQIKRALHRHAEEDAKNISIEVIGDEVELTGRVDTHGEKREVEWAAWGTPGVRKVKSNMRVSYGN